MSNTTSSLSQRRPTFIYTIISVAAVLFLLGFFGLILLQSQQLTKTLKEQVDIIVELIDNVATEEREKLNQQLSQSPFILINSIEYTSKKDALEFMSDDLGEDLISLDLPNPLYDIYTFNVPANYLQNDSLQQISTLIKQSSIVNDVYYQENIIEQLTRNRKRISWVMLGLSFLFVLIAITVIHNTIRLSLYANRFIIKTQELVGATWEFISRPYLKKALWHGLISALCAIALLVGLQLWLQQQVPEIRDLQHPIAFGSMFVGLIILGMFINWLSTYVVVRRYLRLREDELY